MRQTPVQSDLSAKVRPDIPLSVRPRTCRPEFPMGETALDRLADAVIALDHGQRITYCNRAAEMLYGVVAAEVVGTRFRDVVPYRRDASGLLQRSPDSPADTGDLANGRAIHVTRDGREIPVRVSVTRCGQNGDPHCDLAIISDDSEYSRLVATLHERVEFERLLANLSARFSSLPEDQVDGEIEHWLRRLVEILEVDRSSFAELTPGGGVLVTHAYARPGIEPHPKGLANSQLPWFVGEMCAKRMVVLPRVPEDLPEDASAERQYLTAIGIRSGILIPVEIGHSLICILTFSSLRGPRDWPAEQISRLQLAGDVFANAVVRRQAKQRLEQKQHELAHIGRVAAMGELASVIAHELDQPLTAVVSNAQAIRFLLENDQPDLGEADDALNDVIDAAMRVSEIVDRERRLLRRSERKLAAVDVNELIREIELFIRAEARQDGARLSLELVPGLPTIMADRILLQQVILNLARNGFQAMMDQPRERRTLRIDTASRSGEVAVSVSDMGPPVEDELLERMFEPFYTTKKSGLGMGLSISKSIIEAHHGRIWATRNSNEGGGGGERGGLTIHVAIPHAGARGDG